MPPDAARHHLCPALFPWIRNLPPLERMQPSYDGRVVAGTPEERAALRDQALKKAGIDPDYDKGGTWARAKKRREAASQRELNAKWQKQRKRSG